MKDVSVIITCYNKGKLILEALNSVKAQTYANIEIIIVDDCSTDKNTQIILSELSKSGDYNVILLEKNIGVSEARNIGVKNSQGKYILLLDGDDKISSTYVEEAVNILKTEAEIKIVTCEVELFGYIKGKMSLAEPTIEHLIAENSIVISSLFRKEDFDKSNGFNSNMKEGFEDWDYWLSILETDGKVYRIPKTHFYYRISKRSRNNLNFEDRRRLRKQIYENHKKLYSNYLLDPIDSFEYNLLKNSNEYQFGKKILKPIRYIQTLINCKK